MMTAIEETAFHRFLKDIIQKGGFTNDDVIAVIMPLLEEVYTFHIAGKVAPLNSLDALLITNNKLDIEEHLVQTPANNLAKIKELLPNLSQTFEVSGQVKQSTSIGETNSVETKNRLVQTDISQPILFPVYLLNYRCYEMVLGHHDAAGDVFVLGMILASIALGLDFTDEEDLRSFADNRESMIYLNAKIHPSIANIIAGMTHLDRRKRWKDLSEIIDNLKNYRDYNPELEHDLTEIARSKGNQKQSRQQFIQSKLRNRLFDTSRRNRLLYFKSNLKFLNLSISSVPQVLNYHNINADSLFYWNKDIAEKITKGKDISLSKYIRFEDNAYIAPSLDRIRLEANKDLNEYGFSQLKLVISFLNWYNTKEQITEKICSPLLLVPVNLVKKKGLKDQFILEIVDAEVEINPVLSFMLKDLYNIRLPETIQLADTSLEDIFENLKSQIEKNKSGVILEYACKPKIKLIHAQAKQTLSQYKRKVNKNRKINSYHNLDYSYSADNFQPLGLQLFRNFVKPLHSSLEFLVNSDIKPQTFNYTDTSIGQTERELYHLDEGTSNPFKWEFDTCNMVLGNFNYKKMSLVQDYNSIIEGEINSPVFESLFSDLPKKIQPDNELELKLQEQFNVVQSDPTQNKSVAFARKGESYIIQGPPGTGKSQTISNLIADYAARGKKVLFVCEKRAAIDVVFHRLKQQQLDQLCCLIHDSQTDKKGFIMNLKDTYEHFTQKPLPVKQIESARNKIISQIHQEIESVQLFHSSMQANLDGAGLKLRELLEILLVTKQHLTQSDEATADSLEGYGQWLRFGESIENLSDTSKKVSGNEFYAAHPLKHLDENVFLSDRTANEVKATLSKSAELISEIAERLEMADIPTSATASIRNIKKFLHQIEVLIPFKENDRLELLSRGSELSLKLTEAVQLLESLQEKVKHASEKNSFWLNKFSLADAESAYDVVSKYENSFFSFLNSGYQRTKKTILQSYDFGKHQVKPSFTKVLDNLIAAYYAEDNFQKEKQGAEKFFGLDDIFELIKTLKEIEEEANTQVLYYAKQEDVTLDSFKELKQVNKLFKELDESLSETVTGIATYSLENLELIIQQIIEKSKDFPAFAPIIKDLSGAHTSLKKLILHENYLPVQIQGLLAKSSLNKFSNLNRDFEKIEGERIQHHIAKVKKMYKDLMSANSQYLVAKQQERLNQLILRSEMSMAGATAQEKEEKRSLVEGRKILGNEFGKSMRYRSIRDLAASESGQIIRELKPVWLMSPLSVSDTLPLQANYFDVVIFDEASQITLEEGIPPIYRASQIIIVGDEMQMPPSNFFSSSSSDPDDLWEDDDDEASKHFSLDADSFLTQGARKFPSVMLGWHYRSRHESLIGFSNASFYKNELLTIPDALDNHRELPEIAVDNKEDALINISAILERPISYHFLKNGVYDSRSNIAEAEYIAELIRALLFEKNGLSIGAAAFSMEQQGEIENAIAQLCLTDKEFEKLLEEEYKRMEDSQFAGIFFKNLENIQGDERDIIIISTCYGYDPKGKMMMNFGPINRRGGEKRLNVLFSRAKKRMCVVSSIKYTDIKNEYNEGANYFRKYLQYAELASKGDMETANLVLKSVVADNLQTAPDFYKTVVIDQINNVLNHKGFITKTLIGQSYFKCHIGIKQAQSDDLYILGILIDDSLHYANNNLLEQYLFKPEILRASGWKVIQVFSKDWYDNPEKVISRITSSINGTEITMTEIEPGIPADIPENEHVEPLPQNEQPKVISAPSGITRLINTENNSNKFWEVWTEGQNLIIQYGRIDTKGLRLVKTLDSEDFATIEKEKLVRQKISKGYRSE